MKLHLFFSAMIVVLLLTACDSESHQQQRRSEDDQRTMNLSESDLSKLSDKTIFFGHQSIGANILDGLLSLQRARPIIKIHTISKSAELKKGSLNHMYLGQNYDPFGKIKGFVQILSEFENNPPDIAFFKFCYLDVDQHTDILRLFECYKKAVAEIEKQSPEIVIMHATVPLLQIQTGPKAWIKRVIGKPVTGLSDNVARAKFDELLRAEYGGRAVVFDIAEFESTYPDGGREVFTRDDKRYYALIPQYSDDGAHLNEQGRKILAARLVHALGEAAEQHGRKRNQ